MSKLDAGHREGDPARSEYQKLVAASAMAGSVDDSPQKAIVLRSESESQAETRLAEQMFFNHFDLKGRFY